MKFNKLFASILVFGLVNYNLLPSMASTLSPDGRYETINTHSISLKDIMLDDTSKMKIQGNSLVNNIGQLYNPSSNATVSGNTFSFTYNSGTVKGYFRGSTMKENTKYTVFYNIVKNTLVKTSGGNLDYVMKLTLTTPHNTNGGCFFINSGETGLFKKVITTPAVKDNTPYIETTPNSTYEPGGQFEIKDIVVVEGDYSNINIGYFEGMQSSFENQLITQDMVNSGKEKKANLGKYKVEIKSVGKNQDNTKNINAVYLNSPMLKEDTLEYIDGSLTHVKRYNKIILDGSSDENWTMPSLSNNTKTYLFNMSSSIDTIYATAPYLLSDRFPSLESLWSDTTAADTEGVDLAGSSAKKNFHLRINKDKLSGGSVAALRSYLEKNPITVIYKLSEPVYEAVPGNLNIPIFEDTTSITNNSNIPSKMEITIDRVINKALEAITLANANPTVQNIAVARMWTNLITESTKKDELQNKIDNITEVADIELERKTVTSNLDVYIKYENLLSMSLSTNSITFENYSGIDDLENLSALDITINSSLPYDLKARLESAIQNNDKSKTIDAETLKIKESSLSSYQNFAGVKDEITLLDNCEAGNYVTHSIDLKLQSNKAIDADVYKTTIRFEVAQQ